MLFDDQSGIDLEANYRCTETADECSGVALGKTFLGKELLPIYMRQNGKTICAVRKCPYCRGKVTPC